MPVMKVGPGRALLGGGGNYNDLVMGTRPIAYWPLDESAGTVARCLVNTAQNGTYTGVTLANDNTGPFGTPAPWFDGATSYTNIYSATLAAAFDGAEGSAMLWIKVHNAGTWTDVTNRRILELQVDATNFVEMVKTNGNNRFDWRTNAGGVAETIINAAANELDWICVGISWSKAADKVIAYWNGLQNGAAAAGIGVWAGALAATKCTIGAQNTVPQSPWHGWAGPCAIWDRPLSPAEMLATATT